LSIGNAEQGLAEGAWNPGISSKLTRELLALATIFRPENAVTDLKQAIELRQVTGLALEELVVFRPERLALHEILVRITGDFEVPDPATANVPSLGINFRHMVQTVLSRGFEPSRTELVRAYDEMKRDIARIIEHELASTRPVPVPGEAHRSPWRRRQKKPAPPAREAEWDREERLQQDWATTAAAHDNALHAAALHGLIKAGSAIRSRYGSLQHRSELLAAVATNLACNAHGADRIGRLIDPWIRQVAEQEGFRPLPRQDRPILMIIKGASASGKSTMRPLQRNLAARMGLHWCDFALISPDIWRRVLLEFDSLGSLHKYAGMLTGHELEIIDQKLTTYLRRKGEHGLLSHSLIDRFRFDTFALDSDENRYLVSHFAGLVCYSFMVTPPHETIERAWRRGLEVGRYKAVDDLLAHNIDAFTGMQKILFARALTASDSLHYEFLDNDVPRGSVPLTIAFGWGGEMNILEVPRMLDICRYQKINIGAKTRDEVYPDAKAMAPEENVEFLTRCLRRFPRVNLADRSTGRIHARFASGALEWVDDDALESALADTDTRAALRRAAPSIFDASRPCLRQRPAFLLKDRYPTVGRWGEITDSSHPTLART
jgi:hypothetical protein